MKAAILEKQAPVGSRPLRIVDLETPKPDEGDVLIRVSACGVCRTDLHVVEGDLPLKHIPITPGHQIVGIVENSGQRVGVAWLHRTCGRCRFCISGRENLCENADFTGWTRNGGFAEFVTAPADFVYPLPENFPDLHVAPLLCAGIIGYRG